MTGRVKRKPGSGLKWSVRTTQLIKAVMGRISRNPVRSMMKMAKELSVSKHTIKNVVRKDLKTKSRARIKKHMISTSGKEKRFERSKKLLSLLKKSQRPSSSLMRNCLLLILSQTAEPIVLLVINQSRQSQSMQSIHSRQNIPLQL